MKCFKQLITLIKTNCQDDAKKTGYLNVLEIAVCGLAQSISACWELSPVWEQGPAGAARQGGTSGDTGTAAVAPALLPPPALGLNPGIAWAGRDPQDH